MAIPTSVGSGAITSAVGAITPALPASLAVDDILLLPVETRAGQASAIANANGGTWASVQTAADSGGGAAGTRLEVFWSRYNGTQGDPTTNDSGDHQIGKIFAFRGCIATGDPWDVLSSGNKAVASTTVAITGATTTVADCLVVVLCTRDNDLTGAHFSNVVNADLAALAEIFDGGQTAGDGGGFVVATGEKATAGAYGDTTADIAVSVVNAFQTIALKPPAGGAFNIDAQPGSYALSGIAATVPAARLISSNPGSYAVTGLAASVPAGRAINAAAGSYAVTGSVAGLLATRVINVAPGTYAVSGQNASLVAAKILSVDPGAYVITGIAAELALAGVFALSADPGSYALTGATAGLVAGRIVVAAPGAYVITGQSAGLIAARLIAALPGSYLLTGADANLLLGTPQIILWPDAIAPHFSEESLGRILSPELPEVQ